MTARVICTASAKGGTGKTTLTAAFGTVLAAIGKRVLLIDTDAATNGLSLFYLHKVVDRDLRNDNVGLFESRMPNSSPEPLSIGEGLDLIPTTYRFQNTETVSFERYESALRATLAVYRSQYDYIFIDTQAGSDQFARAALNPRISDDVVIVSEYDPMSAAGIERLKALFREELDFRRTWILLNKLLPDYVKSFSEFLEVAKYLTPIPWNADVVRSYARQTLALDLVDGNEYTLAVVRALTRLIGEEDGERLEAWLSARVGSVRKSLEDRIEELQAMTSVLREEQLQYRRRRVLPRMLVIVAAAMTTVGISLAFTITAKQSSTEYVLAGLAVALTGVLTAYASTNLGSASEEDTRLKAKLGQLESETARLQMLRDLAERDRMDRLGL
jgi:cellulose biosynthesis protein BcsQ